MKMPDPIVNQIYKDIRDGEIVKIIEVSGGDVKFETVEKGNGDAGEPRAVGSVTDMAALYFTGWYKLDESCNVAKILSRYDINNS